MSLTIPTIFSAIDKLSAPVSKMTGNVQSFAQKAEASVARFDRGLRRLTPSLGAVGKEMIRFGGVAAIGAFLYKSGQDVVEFEKKIASLSAITGVSGPDLDNFKSKIFEVANATKQSSIAVAKGFELVGSAKPELLKSADGLAAVTNAAILMSQASGDEMEVSVQSLVGTMNQFGLAADQASRVVNVLAAGSKEGAAAIPAIAEAMDKFGVVAASMNVNVEQSVGIIETLAEQNIKGAEAGTKLRNVLTKMATAKALPKEALDQLSKYGVNTTLVMDKSIDFSVRLKELSKIQGDATAMAKVFGVENLVAGQILLQNVEKVDKYTAAVTGTNIAQEQADKNMSTFSKKMESLSNRWTNLVTSSDAVNGKLSFMGSVIDFVSNNLETIVGIIGIVISAWVGMRLALFAARNAILLYNIGLGVMGAVSGTASIAIGANTAALTAYNIATKVAGTTMKIYTAIQWVANAAMTAFPITLLVVGIIALVAAIAYLIYKFKDWIAQLWIVQTVMKLVSGFIDLIKQKWTAISDGFTNGGIIGGLKAIGLVLLDNLLMPLNLILKLASKIPGMGDLTGSLQGKISEFRASLETENVPAVNPKKSEQDALTKTIETSTNSNATLTVVAPVGSTKVEKDKNFMPITTSTMGAI